MLVLDKSSQSKLMKSKKFKKCKKNYNKNIYNGQYTRYICPMLSNYTDARLGQNESLLCLSWSECCCWVSNMEFSLCAECWFSSYVTARPLQVGFSFNLEDVQRRRVCLCDHMVTCSRATCNLCIQILEHDVIFWLDQVHGKTFDRKWNKPGDFGRSFRVLGHFSFFTTAQVRIINNGFIKL